MVDAISSFGSSLALGSSDTEYAAYLRIVSLVFKKHAELYLLLRTQQNTIFFGSSMAVIKCLQLHSLPIKCRRK